MRSDRLPLSFRLAQLLRGLPDFPGRDTLFEVLLQRDVDYPDAVIRGHFGGGLRYEGNPARDHNLLELPMLRFGKPALASVLEAALAPGDVFADVGANVGLYTLWAARIVGPGGRVHSFEPVPRAAAVLARNAEVNGFTQVEVNACAVGAETGTVELHLMALHTGRSSRYALPEGERIEVPLVTLDAHLAGRPTPRLVKIDVEGMEFEVFRGARELLRRADAPLLVFEAVTEFFEAAGGSYAEVLRYLAEQGYAAHALTSRGLRREAAGAARPGSLNVLAAKDRHPQHEAVLARLARTRFPANQNS